MGWRFAGGGGGGGAETDPVASPLAGDAQAAADAAQADADASAKKDQNLTDLTSASAARTAIGVPATADVMLKADSLAGIASASAGRTALALGTAALADTGTGPGDVPVLDGSGRMPAVDGSQMTNLPGGATALAVAQTAHGFAVGDAIRRGSGSYAEAEADSAANAEVVGIVTAVAGANNFTYQPVGPVITGLSGLTDGETYFLDPATPGVITATEPSTDGQISKPVLIAISTTSGVLLGMRGMVVGGGGAAALSDHFSMARVGAVNTVSMGGGSYTVGVQFLVVDDVGCTGVRFYWTAAGERTVRVKLWSTVQLATADVAVNGTGLYTGTFAAPVALTPYTTYYATVWDTTGAEYPALSNLVRVPARPFLTGVVDILDVTYYGSGDSIPNSGGSSSYPVDPVIE